MKKIRVTVPYLMKENLESDAEHFNMKLGAIGNRILSYYSNKKIDKVELKSEGGEIIQFNLSKSNDEIFIETLREQGFDAEADYFRNIFYEYLNNPKYKREEIIFCEAVNKVKDAIENEKKIRIIYGEDKEVRVVNPYFIKVADRENRSYLFCWCEKNSDFRCYRVSKIKSVSKSINNIEYINHGFIKEIKKNFDPFLSYGKEIKVKLTNNGEKILESAVTNRPVFLRKDEFGNFIFQCDEKLAQVYFPQFFSHAEIIEPINLREWFKNKFEDGMRMYEK